mmetsp:Transcript_35391/g.64797  ORF Transcript_35391/g.64797 Transcript_35391/m.64797 type:complete len:194 (+) Transcript_35391:54-635(+)
MPRHFLAFPDSEAIHPDASSVASDKILVARPHAHSLDEVSSSFINVDSPAVAFANLQARTKARVEHWQQAWEDLQYTYIWHKAMRKLQKHAKAEAFLLGGMAGGVALLAASGSSEKTKRVGPAQDVRLTTRRKDLELSRSLASARWAPASEAGRLPNKAAVPTGRSRADGQASSLQQIAPRLQQIPEESSDSM